jgi:hypothetical protein
VVVRGSARAAHRRPRRVGRTGTDDDFEHNDHYEHVRALFDHLDVATGDDDVIDAEADNDVNTARDHNDCTRHDDVIDGVDDNE